MTDRGNAITTDAPDAPNVDVIEGAGFRDLDPDGVIEQPFYERYNKNLEMPISFASAVFIFVAIGFLFVWSMGLHFRKDTRPVPMVSLGEDDSGAGSRDGGGQENPLEIGQPPTSTDLERLKDVPQINEINDQLKDKFKIDIGGDVDIPDSYSLPIARLEKELRDKLSGGKKGTGGGVAGGDVNGGVGPGGFGSDSTRARGLRWILTFDTRSGKDYLAQLHAMKAVIVVPAADGKRLYLFKDLLNPRPGVVASDSEVEELSQKMQFAETKASSVDAVIEALGITDYKPVSFFAFFPKEVEEKMAALEKSYRNKDSKTIKSTKYKVIVKGGSYELIVTEQIMK